MKPNTVIKCNNKYALVNDGQGILRHIHVQYDLHVNVSNKSLIIALDFSTQPLSKIFHLIKAKYYHKSY